MVQRHHRQRAAPAPCRTDRLSLPRTRRRSRTANPDMRMAVAQRRHLCEVQHHTGFGRRRELVPPHQEHLLVELLAPQPAGDLVVALARAARPTDRYDVVTGRATATRQRQNAVLLQREASGTAVGATTPEFLQRGPLGRGQVVVGKLLNGVVNRQLALHRSRCRPTCGRGAATAPTWSSSSRPCRTPLRPSRRQVAEAPVLPWPPVVRWPSARRSSAAASEWSLCLPVVPVSIVTIASFALIPAWMASPAAGVKRSRSKLSSADSRYSSAFVKYALA